MDKLLAAALAFIVANTLHYGFGRSWIFRGTERAAVSAAMSISSSMPAIGLVVTLALFAALLRFTPINYLVARVLVSVFAGLTVFVLNAMLNFRRL